HSRAASFSANKASHLRRPSVAADILRSASSRSPNPLSPGEEVPDIYRKQAQTISELTVANEKLEADLKTLQEQYQKLGQAAEENEELKDKISEVKAQLSEYRSKVEESEKLKEERDEELEKLVSLYIP